MTPPEKEFINQINAHQRILHKLAAVYCYAPEDRKDLVQEMILQAWRSYGHYRGDAAFGTWLYRIALNTAITHLKKETRRPDKYTTANLPNTTDSTTNEVEEEQLKTLYQAIKQLNGIEKALIALYLDNLPYQTIAEILGITPNNVGVKMSRVKDKLSKLIQQQQL